MDKCPLCGKQERGFLFSGHEHEYPQTTDLPFNFYRCNGCSLVYVDPRPAQSELSRIYPENYYARASVNASPDDLDLHSFVGRTLHKRLIGRMGGNITPYFKLGPEHVILDVGCGGGRSLKSLHLAYGCRAVGIDMDATEAVARKFCAAPITMLRGEFLSYDFSGATFDVVYASHLIEHLPDPKGFLQKAYSILKPAGLCIIETPNEDCFAFRLFGRNWGGNHIPRHWFLLNPMTAAEAARRAAGDRFDVLGVHFGPNAAFWIWSFHSLFTGLRVQWIADILFPSDHRIVSTSPINIMRHGFFTMLDLAVLFATGNTGNMSVIYRKRTA